jgi:predicted porin
LLTAILVFNFYSTGNYFNKKTGAGAIFAAASVAQAGIIIPAGDWTVDIGGNMNAFYTGKKTDYSYSGNASFGGNTFSASGNGSLVDGNTIGTGLLPSALGIGAKTRQNDLDVSVQFTFFTGSSSGSGAAGGNNTLNIRQSFLTFGDKSWGQFKLGRDLGVFGSDAILSDMTLLGVGVSTIGAGGSPNAAGGNSTLGRIGSGYIYADWVGQIQYQTPNFSGFQVTAAVSEPLSNGAAGANQEDMGYEAKATYDFAASDVTGRVWVGGISQKHATGLAGSSDANGYTSRGAEVGAKLAVHDLGLVGYYYDGKGLDSQLGVGGLKFGNGFKSDDDGGYVQATYVLPTKTKLGASWGKNESSGNVSGISGNIKNESWIIGAYHPLTKHLNLVAEYTNQEKEYTASTSIANGRAKFETDTYSLGAILFF